MLDRSDTALHPSTAAKLKVRYSFTAKLNDIIFLSDKRASKNSSCEMFRLNLLNGFISHDLHATHDIQFYSELRNWVK